MIQTWNSWKRFPDVRTGGQLDAPVGPGVYEVHHTLTGRVIAFGHTGDVANALNHLKLNGGGSILSRLFRRQPLAARVSEFTAFMYLGELIEFDTTSKMFTAPQDQRTQDYITGRFG